MCLCVCERTTGEDTPTAVFTGIASNRDLCSYPSRGLITTHVIAPSPTRRSQMKWSGLWSL